MTVFVDQQRSQKNWVDASGLWFQSQLHAKFFLAPVTNLHSPVTVWGNLPTRWGRLEHIRRAHNL